MLALGVVAVDAQGDAVHAAQVLHEERLAFHDAESAGRRHIAVPENAGGIADHGDKVAPVGQFKRGIVVIPDGCGDLGYAGGVPDVEPVEPVDTGLGDGHHLAAIEFVGIVGELLQEQGLPLGDLRFRKILREGLP